jgi:SanA protein
MPYFNAEDVSIRTGLRTQVREKMARVKVFIDFLFSKKPKFLGDKIQIPS